MGAKSAIATEEIQREVFERHGFIPPAAWIAHCKLLSGIRLENVRLYQQVRENPCPKPQQAMIQAALRDLINAESECLIGLA